MCFELKLTIPIFLDMVCDATNPKKRHAKPNRLHVLEPEKEVKWKKKHPMTTVWKIAFQMIRASIYEA